MWDKVRFHLGVFGLRIRRRGLDSLSAVVSCCWHDYEKSDSTKYGEFLNYLSNCELLRSVDRATCTSLVTAVQIKTTQQIAKRAVKSQVNYFERSHLKSQPKYPCNWHSVCSMGRRRNIVIIWWNMKYPFGLSVRSMGRRRNIVILNMVIHEVSIWTFCPLYGQEEEYSNTQSGETWSIHLDFLSALWAGGGI